MANHEFDVVLWSIHCFDRRKENSFPPDIKHYVLDESRCSQEDTAAILQMIEAGKHKQEDVPAPKDGWAVTISYGVSGTSREILRYRDLFTEYDSDALTALFEERERSGRPSGDVTVSLIGEYFEDETGKEISLAEMCDHVSGTPTMVQGVPGSVTRFPPSQPINKDKWKVESANLLAHFLQVVDRL